MSRNIIAQIQRGASFSHRLRPSFTRNFHTTLRVQEQFHNANEETFKSVVLDGTADKIILVDFYADWCQPCKTISPVLEKLASDPTVRTGSGKPLHLVTINTEEQFDLVQKYQIRSLPTVIAFEEGQTVNRFIGALNEPGIRKFLQSI